MRVVRFKGILDWQSEYFTGAFSWKIGIDKARLLKNSDSIERKANHFPQSKL